MRPARWIVALLLLAAGSADAAQRPQIAVQELTLGNGMRWLLFEQTEVMGTMGGLRFRLITGRLAPEDRCHLNGLAVRDGQPRYVTAVSQSDVVDAWREANPWAREFWGAHRDGESFGVWGAAMRAWESPGEITTAACSSTISKGASSTNPSV